MRRDAGGIFVPVVRDNAQGNRNGVRTTCGGKPKRRGLGKPEIFTFLDLIFSYNKTRGNSRSNGSPDRIACG